MAFGLARKLAASQKGPSYTIRCPEDVASYLMEEMRHLPQEHFVVMFLVVIGDMFTSMKRKGVM